MIKNKKGMTLGDAYPAVLTIVLIGLILSIGLYIMTEVRSGIATTITETDVHANVNGTASDFANTTTLNASTYDNYYLLTVTAINGSGAGTFTNFTWVRPGTITWGNDIAAQPTANANVTTTYTWDRVGSAEAAIQDVVEGTDDFADWIAIIVVVIAAAIVLGVVLSSFGRRRPGV